jgi:hypothetical protein
VADKLVFDCSTRQQAAVPLTSAEQAEAGQRAADDAVRRQQDSTATTNRQTVAQRAQAALNANATFLALATPSAAQTTAQVKTLTKECNALIRLLLGLLADVSDTA